MSIREGHKTPIHQIAYNILKELNRPASFREIWEIIDKEKLYSYSEGVDEPNVTRSSIEKKCINSTRTGFPRKEVLFFRNNDGLYGLYENLQKSEKILYLEKKLENFISDIDYLIEYIENNRLDNSFNIETYYILIDIVEYLKEKNNTNQIIENKTKELTYLLEESISSIKNTQVRVEKEKLSIIVLFDSIYNAKDKLKNFITMYYGENEYRQLFPTESTSISNENLKLIQLKEESIKKLKNSIKELEANDENNTTQISELELKIEEEINEKEKLKLKNEELEQYVSELAKIEKAIEKLKKPAEQLIESKNHFISERANFDFWSNVMFILSTLMFLGVFYYLSFSNDLLTVLKGIKISSYLVLVFPIAFPMIIGFLFVRQSNLKSQEIEKTNKRFILIHEVNQSLEALVEVNRGKDMDGKTEQVIDKLINNILDFASESSENINQKNELFELNNKVDSIINTFKTKIDAGEIIQK